MSSRITDQQIIEYITLRDDSPESRAWVARMNAAMKDDPELKKRVGAFELLYDAVKADPEKRRAFLRMTQPAAERQKEHN